jgi:hypothetical protein
MLATLQPVYKAQLIRIAPEVLDPNDISEPPYFVLMMKLNTG